MYLGRVVPPVFPSIQTGEASPMSVRPNRAFASIERKRLVGFLEKAVWIHSASRGIHRASAV